MTRSFYPTIFYPFPVLARHYLLSVFSLYRQHSHAVIGGDITRNHHPVLFHCISTLSSPNERVTSSKALPHPQIPYHLPTSSMLYNAASVVRESQHAQFQHPSSILVALHFLPFTLYKPRPIVYTSQYILSLALFYPITLPFTAFYRCKLKSANSVVHVMLYVPVRRLAPPYSTPSPSCCTLYV